MLEFVRAWLFPPACAGCDSAGVALCALCAPSPGDAVFFAIDGVPAFALGSYDGPVRRAVVAMKHGERDPIDAFAALLDRAPIVGTLVPVPTSRGRAAQRGFDQSVELARRIATRRDAPFAQLLQKRGPAQDGLTRARRLLSAGRFTLATSAQLPATATLIDDVCTTGATLRDAMRALASGGTTVESIIVVARTPADRHRTEAGSR